MQAGIRFTRLLISATACSLAVTAVGCVASSPAPAYGQYPGYPAYPGYNGYQPVAPGAPGPAPAPEGYYAGQPRQHTAGLLFLPGRQNQQLVKYSVVGGQAVMDGDILLGPAASLPLRYGLPWAPMTNVRSAVASAVKSHLWPNAEIPFVIDRSISPQLVQVINGAVAHLNTSPLKARPKRDTDRDFVVFKDTNSGCSSFIGRVGGPQDINLTSGCGVGSAVHEMLHAGGFFHEQSRGDRDDFITINFNEIQPGFEDNFEKRDARGQDIGAYDFGSIMHYSGRAFSRSGRPTIVPKVAGVTLGQREALSTLDRAAIEFLYGSGAAPPTTPATVPPGTIPGVPGPSQPPVAAGGTFAGNYSSSRGNVTCTQSGNQVNCTYPGGAMICGASGAQLDCGWSGGGQGRASFTRQANGVVAGTFGDFFSHDSRGPWSLVPLGGTTPAPSTPTPGPAPVPAGPGPASGPVSLSGNYTTTRGPMACNETGTSIVCNFQETPSVTGRLDCNRDQTGSLLSCTWVTFLPPGSGRASFTRQNVGDRNLTGTWGHFTNDKGGGTWTLTGQP